MVSYLLVKSRLLLIFISELIREACILSFITIKQSLVPRQNLLWRFLRYFCRNRLAIANNDFRLIKCKRLKWYVLSSDRILVASRIIAASGKGLLCRLLRLPTDNLACISYYYTKNSKNIQKMVKIRDIFEQLPLS